jgi:hypothetical protein
MKCLQIAEQRGKSGIRYWSVTRRAPTTTTRALFIKIQFQNPLHTKDEKFCRNGWALVRDAFFFRSLSVGVAELLVLFLYLLDILQM